jgi:hypothetical protein
MIPLDIRYKNEGYSDKYYQFAIDCWKILPIENIPAKPLFKGIFARNPLDKAFGQRNFVSYIQVYELIALLHSLSGLRRMCS